MPHRVAILAAALVLALAPPARAALRIKAFEGQPVPGTAGVLHAITQPVLNGSDAVVFTAFLAESSEAGPVFHRGVFRVDAEGLQLLARFLDPAPGILPEAPFVSFGLPSIDDAGRVVFEALLDVEAPGVDFASDEGIWRTDPDGNLELVAREGDPAPGLDGAVFTDFESLVLGAAGHVVFSEVAGRGIWGATPGQPPQALVLAGDAAPGGGMFTQFRFLSRVNAAGDFAFYGVTDEGAGVWSFRGGAPLEKCLAHGPAPGIPGASILAVSSLDLNEAGDVAIGADLTPTLDAAGYVFETGSGLRLVATAGMEIEGQGGAQFEAVGFEPLLDGEGRVSLFGTAQVGSGDVTEESDEAVWRIAPAGPVEVVAREGAPTPEPSLSYRVLRPPVTNSGGDLALFSHLRSEEGETIGALFRANAGEAPELLAREGDLVEIGPGQSRVVSQILGPLRYTTERRDALMNDAGHVALRVHLEEGFAAAVAAPEPAQGLLLAVGAAALCTAGRRRGPLRQ
jgi:hypothetical protein